MPHLRNTANLIEDFGSQSWTLVNLFHHIVHLVLEVRIMRDHSLLLSRSHILHIHVLHGTPGPATPTALILVMSTLLVREILTSPDHPTAEGLGDSLIATVIGLL